MLQEIGLLSVYNKHWEKPAGSPTLILGVFASLSIETNGCLQGGSGRRDPNGNRKKYYSNGTKANPIAV
jgi:hypothetical protein